MGSGGSDSDKKDSAKSKRPLSELPLFARMGVTPSDLSDEESGSTSETKLEAKREEPVSGRPLSVASDENLPAAPPAPARGAPIAGSTPAKRRFGPPPMGGVAERSPLAPRSAAPAARGAVEDDDALDEPRPPRHLSVTELTAQIRGVLEPSFSQVWVQGEISNYRPAASGHAYFSLKDSGSSVSAAIFGWGSQRMKRKFELRDGMQVLCRGKISVYPPRGTYQLAIDHIEPLGAGALQVAFEQLKAKLEGEGLFDRKRKRELPAYPARIAVVTSPSGAAIQDMLNILRRRAPHLRVLVIPALVQGDAAPAQILRGLEQANRHSLGDVVVLARGGGSIEDLWAFNDESLARAIAASRLPVISAVGHEIDFTIADFVADLRAPTPSAAAEIVSGQWVEAIARIGDSQQRLRAAIVRELGARRTLLEHVRARVVSPRDRLREQAQRCDDLYVRLERALRLRLERRLAQVHQLAGKLDALSPLRVLERGYSIVRDAKHPETVIKSAKQVDSGQELRITFQDGQLPVRAL